MISFLLNLLLMSLLLAVFGIAALIFRKKWLRGKGGAMYSVWAGVLLLCVVPLRLLPAMNLSGNFDFDSLMPQKVVLPGSEEDARHPEAGNFKLTLISDIAEVNAGERLDALYALQPKVISDGLDLTAEKLLDKTSNYLFPLFAAGILVWIAGMLLSFGGTILDYTRMKRRLTDYSSVYGESMDGGRAARLLAEAKARVGEKRQVNLRIVKRVASVSPCVCGLVRPVIFLGEDILLMADEQIALILTHELVHCHRLELLYKTAAGAVAAVHWFNPLMPDILRAVYEDCELSCDSKVLALCGEDHCDYYMMTLLDVAEMYCCSACAGDRVMASGVYLAGSSGKSFLKRRYMNMKTCTRKGMKKGSVIFLALCLLVNIVIMSACGAGDAEIKAEEDYRINPINSAIYNYFDAVENSVLTEEQLASIKSIEVKLAAPEGEAMQEYYEGMKLLCVYINGEYEMPYGSYVPKDDLEDVVDCIEAYDETMMKKISAFYSLKDPNDPNLTEEAKQEMLELYPAAAEGAIYIFDPYATRRERISVGEFIKQSGSYVTFTHSVEGVTELVNDYVSEKGLDCTVSVTEIVFSTESELDILGN